MELAAALSGAATNWAELGGPDMPLVLDDGNPGTVWFAEKVTHNPGGWSGSGSNQRYRGPSTTREQIGFRRIEGAREVYPLMLDAVAARAGGQG